MLLKHASQDSESSLRDSVNHIYRCILASQDALEVMFVRPIEDFTDVTLLSEDTDDHDDPDDPGDPDAGGFQNPYNRKPLCVGIIIGLLGF